MQGVEAGDLEFQVRLANLVLKNQTKPSGASPQLKEPQDKKARVGLGRGPLGIENPGFYPACRFGGICNPRTKEPQARRLLVRDIHGYTASLRSARDTRGYHPASSR